MKRSSSCVIHILHNFKSSEFGQSFKAKFERSERKYSELEARLKKNMKTKKKNKSEVEYMQRGFKRYPVILEYNCYLEFAVYKREECESYCYKTLLCCSNI
jgi:bisphosphoglycerate-dependent phosphoglycerate mutase